MNAPHLALLIIASLCPLAALQAEVPGGLQPTSTELQGGQNQEKAPSEAKQKPKPIQFIKEPDTGVRYPDRIFTRGTKKPMALAGVAVRDKRFVILVNVYAYALYVEESAIAKHLSAFYQRPAKTLQTDARFFAALGKSEVHRTLRLEFVREVGAKKIRNAFVESVEPRIATAAKKFGWKDGAKALQTFRAYFGNKVKKGQVIEFTWLAGNKLRTTVAGKTLGTIESKALCWALWDTYFGSKPIEKKGKKTVVRQLTERLQRTPKVKAATPKAKPAKDAPAPKKS